MPKDSNNNVDDVKTVYIGIMKWSKKMGKGQRTKWIIYITRIKLFRSMKKLHVVFLKQNAQSPNCQIYH